VYIPELFFYLLCGFIYRDNKMKNKPVQQVNNKGIKYKSQIHAAKLFFSYLRKPVKVCKFIIWMINGISFTFAPVKIYRRERKRSLLLLKKCSERIDFARKWQVFKI
jgi:hypothetical protein